MAVFLEAASDNGRAEREDYEHRATRSLDVQTIPTRSSIKANSLEAQICDSDSKVTSEERTDGKDKSNLSVPFHKLFYFADSCDVVLMVLGTLGAMANGAALPIMTVIFGQLINAFGQNTNNLHVLIHEVSKVAIRFVYIGGAASFASFCGVAFWMCTGERQAARIRGLYLKAILRQDVGFFDKEITTGEVIGRMSGDTILIQEAVGEKVGKFIQLVSTFLGGFSVAFFKGWKLALIMLSTMPLIVAAGGIMSVVISRMSSKGQVAYAEAGSIVEQIVGAIKTVAAFTGEKRAVDAYDKALKQAYKAGILQGMAAGLSLGCVMLVMLSSYALSLWYGSKLVVNHGYSGGAVMNVIFAVLTGGMSLGQASPSLNAFAAGQAAAYKMFEVINRIPEIDVLNMDGLILENFKGDLEIQNVNFFYPARTNFQVFSGFSLLIPSGFTTALVGESGSGKSTVISLIERFYDPQSGQILVDGIDIKHLQLKWYRRQIGLVSQEPVLFGTSIRENIAYGKAEATIEEIQAVAEMANAASFIKKLPKGYDTPVGEHGAQLSGGQKQRVAIARAILKNPRILLLDEATSALDAKSESLVQEALDRIMVNRTTVVVAHRLTTIRNAHCIAVVQHGSIVEKGSHWELMQNPSSAYCQLVRLQQTYQTKEEDNTKGEIDPDNVYIQDDGRSLSRDSSRTSPSMLFSKLSPMRLPFSTSPSMLFSKLSPMRQPFSRSSSKADDRQFFSLDKSSSFGSAKEHVEQREKRSGLLGFCASKDTDDPEKGQHVTRQQTSIWRIAALNKPEAPIFVLGFFSAIGNGMIFPLFGFILSSLIGSFFERNPHKLRQDANFWSCMFLVLACTAFVVTPSQIFCFSVVGHRLISRVRRLTFDKIVRQEISWFDDYENSSGAISARLSTDAAHVRSVVGDSLSLAVQNLATVSVGLVIAFTANWQLSLLILALVPLIGLQGIMQVKFMKGFSSDVKVMYEEASRVANDAVSSIRTVASFGAESKVLKLYEERCKIPLKSGIQQGMISGTGLAFSNFLLYASYSLTFWFGSRLVGERKTEFKNVFKVFFAIVLSALGVAQSAGLAPDIAKVEAAINSVFSILDRKSTIDPYDTTGKVLKLLKGDIEYRNISFRYPTRPDVQIFQDFNLSVPAGKTVALVGESGSGKSTAISLIERFYDPDTGHIFIDGVDIKSLQIKWLRQQIGLVSQEPILFDGTIRSNIAYGRENAVSDKDIQAAAEASNAHNFIASMPDGYNTRVGERGIQLSGGQKQRIAISRAIIKNPKILLLDEATSALDAESESLVQEALDKMMTTQTTLVVAHRLSTIINASVIAVLKNGIVAEQGKHSDLIAINGGLYSSLVKLQKASLS